MPEKIILPKSAEQYLGKCYAIAQWSGTLLLFISVLPYLAMRNNSGKLLASPGLLKAQLSATFAPLFFTVALILVLVFFGIMQNRFFAMFLSERGKGIAPDEYRRLWIPFFRWQELLRLSGGNSLMKASVICAAVFWISLPVLGLLSPLPVYSAAASVILFLRFAGGELNKKTRLACRIFLGLLGIVFIVSVYGAYSSLFLISKFYSIQNSLAAAKGVPADRNELKELIYGDRVPDPEYTRMIDEGAKQSFLTDSLFDARFYCALPESFRADARNTLNSKKAAAFFKPVEQALAAGKKLQYDFALDSRFLWHPGRLPVFKRTVVQYFTGKILTALERRDKDAAMQNFKMLTDYQENCMNGDFLVSLTYIGLFEFNRASVAGYMIGSGILSDDQLRTIAQLNRTREKKLRAALLNALRSEACFEREWIGDMSDPYICIQSTASESGILFDNPLVKFLLRGALPLPPYCWGNVLQKHTLATSCRKYDQVISYFSENVDYSVWKKHEFPAYENMIKKDSSYFVLLGYPSLLNNMESLFNGITFIRMTDLAVNIELFKRKHNRFPEKLEELKIPLPLDAVSGKKLLLRKNGIVEFTWSTKGRDKKFPLEGWVIASDGAPYLELKIPTQWPLPAPPDITAEKK